MKKKFLALVLTLAMVLSLVPATALATNGTQTPDNATQPRTSVTADTEDGVHISKEVVQDGDNYNLVMEAYVEGNTEIVDSSKPLDIVLVLDVSGSMDDPMSSKDKTKRIDALKKAVKGFIDKVADNNLATAENPVGHRISIVKFAGDKTDVVGNDTYEDWGWNHNYSQIVKGLTPVNAAEKEVLEGAVNALKPAGATQADYGMQLAQSELSSNGNSSSDKVVVMFTDGSPNSSNGFDKSVARDAISASKALKDEGVKVYTIGIFSGANPNADVAKKKTSNEDKYMHAVSSNYPGATLTSTTGFLGSKEWHWNFGTRASSDYYLSATSADELENVFQTISNSITTPQVKADENAVLRDTLTDQFVLNGNAEDITVQTAAVIGKDTNGKYIWAKPEPVTTEITKNVSGKTVTVTGFNYTSQDNVITENNGQYSGHKLIVTIPIKVNDAYTGWLADEHYYNTNDVESNRAGLTGYTKNDQEASTLLNESPRIPVTAYTVTYKYDKEYPGAPDLTDLNNDGKAYLPGTSIKIKDAPPWTGYTFNGWTTSNAEINNDKFTMPAENVELTGSWTANNDVSYTVHYYEANTTTEVAPDKSVNNQTFDSTVTENAIDVERYTAVDPTSQQVKLDAYNKEITFYYTANTYTVTWMNGDTLLKKDENVAYNAQPNYGDTTPIKTADSEYTYEFVGWSTDPNETTGSEDNALPPVTRNVTYYAIFTAKPQTYTVIFDANGGKWTDNEDQRQQIYDNRSDFVTPVAENPTQQGYDFDGWAYKTSEDNLELITTFAGASVDRMMQLPKATGTSVTLYAVWKDNDTAPTGSLNYRINQYFIDETGKVANSISKPGRNTVGTAISALISDLIPQDRSFPNYKYEGAKTTVNGEEYTDSKELTQDNTVINLYYYLDSWKDGDIGSGDKTDDSLTDGDGIPDYKQILIQYQVYQKDNGLVTPEFEVVTVKNGNELTAIHGSSVTRTGTGYTFVTWTGQNVAVTEKTVGDIIKETSAEKLKKEKCDLSKDTFEQGKSHTYTAIFLEDKIGGGDNKDQPDGIPDAWQYKVTFKVVNGNWNNNTNQDIVTYVTKKNAEGNSSTNGTAKLTTDQIPPVGNQPNSGYQSSGRWDKTPSTDLNITGDTVFTYTYDKKSGGSGGSGGSHKPTVTIPDDVPTGLNGKDHYAYVVGYPDGMVYPQKNITRAEVATIFFRLLTDETREANMTKSNGYNDMKDGAWYTCAVSTLSKMGIIKGYEDGSFKPDASISRAEFAAIAARFDPDGDKTPATFSDVSSHWAKDEISIAANHGWIKGYEDGSFKPDQKITRAETMTLVNRVLKRLPETKDDLHKDMKTWPDNQKESAWFYLAVQEATNSHYQKLKKDGTHETWESMRETRDWAALEK